MPSKKPLSPEAARLRMASLCARSEQCEYDVRQKLFKLGLPPHDINETIEYLVSNKFISNARFAKSLAHDKCRFSAWGRNKIRMALASKRIDSSLIADALNSVEDEEWLDAARRVAKSKARTLDLHGPDSRNEKIKLYRHLLTRGFESSLASRVVKETAAKP